MLRTTLEQVTHPFAIRRRLPPPFDAARIYATTEGGLRYLRPNMGDVDPVLLGLAEELISPGDIVWDIGANVGLFSFAASVAAGRDGYVLAIEPDVHLVGLLHRSVTVNHGHAPVEVIPAAVADDLGVSRFNIALRNRSTNYLDGFGSSQTGGIRSTHLVPTVTLDWLAERFPAPDIIKIDVEEAEAKVLAKAANVLRLHPKIICEVAARNSAVVTDILTGHGYTLYDADKPTQTRLPTPVASPNTLGIKLPPGRPAIDAGV
jgi:FkbM family methyltransferase